MEWESFSDLYLLVHFHCLQCLRKELNKRLRFRSELSLIACLCIVSVQNLERD